MKPKDDPVEIIKNLSNKFVPEDSFFTDENGEEIVCFFRNAPKVLDVEDFYD
jgi:hypothetical protein